MSCSDVRLNCTLWGNFVDFLHTGCQDIGNGEKTLVLIRFAKINNFKGDISITNTFDASDVIINPMSYPEAQQFMSR